MDLEKDIAEAIRVQTGFEQMKTCIEAEKLRNLMELKELRGINDELKRANKYSKGF